MFLGTLVQLISHQVQACIVLLTLEDPKAKSNYTTEEMYVLRNILVPI
jgi:hypothetical protein